MCVNDLREIYYTLNAECWHASFFTEKHTYSIAGKLRIGLNNCMCSAGTDSHGYSYTSSLSPGQVCIIWYNTLSWQEIHTMPISCIVHALCTLLIIKDIVIWVAVLSWFCTVMHRIPWDCSTATIGVATSVGNLFRSQIVHEYCSSHDKQGNNALLLHCVSSKLPSPCGKFNWSHTPCVLHCP